MLNKRVKQLMLLIGLLVLVYPLKVEAHNHSGYSHTRGVTSDNSHWMASVKDDTKLSQLSIPGTHDTMSNGPGGDSVRTQVNTLPEQLESGIRYIDIRVRETNGKFAIHHGFVYLNAMFGDVLNDSIDFLADNPSEIIFMRLKQEYSNVSDEVFNQVLESYLSNNDCANYIYDGKDRTNPSVKDMRGKIVILRNFLGSDVGINYTEEFNTQDNYKLGTNWDLYDKWSRVKDQLNLANNNEGGDTKYINYLSGNVGAFPYFVASGHSSSGTSAPRLATGLTHPGWAGTYPDFPRVNWFAGIATIAFEGTNVLTTDYMSQNKLKHVGIVVADFPGQGLINNIIGLNQNNGQNNRIPDGTYTMSISQDVNKVLDITTPDQKVIIWDSHGGNNQKFMFQYDESEGAYQIYSKTKKDNVLAWLDDEQDSSKLRGHVNEHKPEDYWLLDRTESGAYLIRNKKKPNLVLDLNNNNPTKGTSIKLNEAHSLDSLHAGAQQFYLNVAN